MIVDFTFLYYRSIDSTDVDALLFDRLGRFLRTHSVKVDLKGSDILGAIESAGRSLEDFNDSVAEGRGKKSEYYFYHPFAEKANRIYLTVKTSGLLPVKKSLVKFNGWEL